MPKEMPDPIFSYAPLFKTLEARGLAFYDLRAIAQISDFEIGAIRAGKPVLISALCRIACALGLELGDIVDFPRRSEREVSEALEARFAEKKRIAERNRELAVLREEANPGGGLIDVCDGNGTPPSPRCRCPKCFSHRVSAGQYDSERGLVEYCCEECGWSGWERRRENKD